MIKILKPGTLKKCTCTNCGAILSYDEKEDALEESVETIKVGYDRFFSESQKYITCPQCDEKIVLHTFRCGGNDE